LGREKEEKKFAKMAAAFPSDVAEMSEDSDLLNYTRYTFGDTEFIVPSRYIELSARGTGAQGMVW
jgi:hypothetical protein